MIYVIASPCVADYSCIEACPVDCISPMPQDSAFDKVEQLYIDPSRCIGCAACVEVCPVDAIFAHDRLPARWKQSAQINQDYFSQLRSTHE